MQVESPFKIQLLIFNSVCHWPFLVQLQFFGEWRDHCDSKVGAHMWNVDQSLPKTTGGIFFPCRFTVLCGF